MLSLSFDMERYVKTENNGFTKQLLLDIVTKFYGVREKMRENNMLV